MGKAHVGNLVGLGCTADFHASAIISLFRLLALINAFDDPARGTKSSSILVLVGLINVPIIKFSVDWWNTLHQPASVLRMGGPSIDESMLWPLLLMAVAFKTYYIWVLLVRIRAEIISNKIRILRLRQVHG